MPALSHDSRTLYSDGERMTAIKAYLLRLILCGFFVSLAGALLRGKRAARAVTLCGGCLMILTTIRPLLRVDLSCLPDLISGMTKTERVEAAREKNEELLCRLVEEQTAAWVTQQAASMGMELTCAVTARAEGGTFVPDRLCLTGSWTEDKRAALSDLLTRELAVSPDHQRWVGG